MLKRAVLVPVLALAAVAMLFAACSDDEEEDATPTVTTTVAAATATATESTAVSFPLTITDLLGREVTIEAAPQAIVTTSPSAIEILYAVGGTAIARSETAAHPAEVAELPSIGPSYQPAFEQIIALQPDLVIADASAQGHLADAFAGALTGVPVIFVGAVGYEDVAASLRLVGQVIGDGEAGEAAAAHVEEVAADLAEAAAAEEAPRVLIVNGASNDFFVAMPESFVGNMVALLHGENIAEGKPQVGQYPGYTQLSAEEIVAADPQVIFAITAGPPNAPRLSETLAANPAFAAVNAVTEGRVHEIDLEVFLQAPGPRAAEGLQQLFGLLYPKQ